MARLLKSQAVNWEDYSLNVGAVATVLASVPTVRVGAALSVVIVVTVVCLPVQRGLCSLSFCCRTVLQLWLLVLYFYTYVYESIFEVVVVANLSFFKFAAIATRLDVRIGDVARRVPTVVQVGSAFYKIDLVLTAWRRW